MKVSLVNFGEKSSKSDELLVIITYSITKRKSAKIDTINEQHQ